MQKEWSPVDANVEPATYCYRNFQIGNHLKQTQVKRFVYLLIPPYLQELDHFNKLVENGELDQLIARYPARESPAFETIARSLKCLNKMDYERMVIARIRQDNELVEKLKKRIGPLSEALEQSGSLAIR